MTRAVLVIVVVSLLAGCATAPRPATPAGECRLFHDPGRPVAGVTRADRQWIAETIEAGVVGCGWRRHGG